MNKTMPKALTVVNGGLTYVENGMTVDQYKDVMNDVPKIAEDPQGIPVNCVYGSFNLGELTSWSMEMFDYIPDLNMQPDYFVPARFYYTFYLRNKEDAMLFKLRWGT